MISVTDREQDLAWAALVQLAEATDYDEASSALAERARQPGFSFDELFRLAVRNRLLQLLGLVASLPACDKISHPLKTHAVDFFGLSRHRSRVATTVAVSIAEAFKPVSVRASATKGVVLEWSLYGGDGTRPYRDVDFMIDPDDRAEAEAALSDAGGDERILHRVSGRPASGAAAKFIVAAADDHLPKRSFLTGDAAAPVVYVDVATSFTWSRSPWRVGVSPAVADVTGVATPWGDLPMMSWAYHFAFVLLHLFREASFWVSMNKAYLGQFRDVRRGWEAMSASDRVAFCDVVTTNGVATPVAWVLEHADRVFGSGMRRAAGLAEPSEDVLHTVYLRGGRRARWSGTMAERLRTGALVIAESP